MSTCLWRLWLGRNYHRQEWLGGFHLYTATTHRATRKIRTKLYNFLREKGNFVSHGLRATCHNEEYNATEGLPQTTILQGLVNAWTVECDGKRTTYIPSWYRENKHSYLCHYSRVGLIIIENGEIKGWGELLSPDRYSTLRGRWDVSDFTLPNGKECLMMFFGKHEGILERVFRFYEVPLADFLDTGFNKFREHSFLGSDFALRMQLKEEVCKAKKEAKDKRTLEEAQKVIAAFHDACENDICEAFLDWKWSQKNIKTWEEYKNSRDLISRPLANRLEKSYATCRDTRKQLIALGIVA